jgi:hypothetical protein
MAFKAYDDGDLIVVTGTFTDRNGAPIDPDTVSFLVKNPSNVITTYVFGTDAELVQDSTGVYHVDISANITGKWYYRYVSTGIGQAAEEGEFLIKKGFF